MPTLLYAIKTWTVYHGHVKEAQPIPHELPAEAAKGQMTGQNFRQ